MEYKVQRLDRMSLLAMLGYDKGHHDRYKANGGTNIYPDEPSMPPHPSLKFIVYDTETLGFKQKEFFSWLNNYLPKDMPRTPDSLLAVCQPDEVQCIKLLKSGVSKPYIEKRAKPFIQSVVDHCNEVAGNQDKPCVKPGIGLFKKAWGTFGMEALDPVFARVHNVQIGLVFIENNTATVKYYCESAENPHTLQDLVLAMYTTGLPILCQNIDFDLRMTEATFGLYPKPTARLYDTMIIQCLLNADGDRNEDVSLKALCQTYDVPLDYRKTGVAPQYVDWRNPGAEALTYALNDILSCAYIFLCQRTHPDFETIKPTVFLEATVRDNLAYASLRGVPVSNRIVRLLHEKSLLQTEEYIVTLKEKAAALGLVGYESWTSMYLGSAEFGIQILTILNNIISCAGLTTFSGGRVRPLSGLSKKEVYTHVGYQILSAPVKEFLAALFKVTSCKKRVNGLTKIRKIVSPDKVTWLHPTYGTVPKPMAAKPTKWGSDAGAGGGTKSGRMSTRGELSPLTMSEVDKQIVVAPKHQFILSCDLSGIELRVAASLSHDKTLIDIVNSGKDPYKLVASKAFGIPYDSIGKKSMERNLGKEAVLAFIFEAKPFTMINQILLRTKGAMVVENHVAKALYDAWWELAPDLKRWSHDNWVKGCITGHYATAKGRIRRFNLEDFQEDLAKAERYGKSLYHPKELTTSNGDVYNDNDTQFRAGGVKYKNLSSNHIVQTTAGEGFKAGLSKFPLRERGWGVIGFIHDDDTLLINDSDKSWAIDFIPYQMLSSMSVVLEEAGGAPIALAAEATMGRCWAKFMPDDAKDYVMPNEQGWYQEYVDTWKYHNGVFTRG